MHRTAALGIGVALAVFIPTFAQEAAPAKKASRTPPSMYWWVSAGNFDGNDNPGQLEDERAQWAVVGGVGIRFNAAFSVDIEPVIYGADYDAPPVMDLFTQASDEYDLESFGLFGSARLSLPKGPVRPYGSLGLGIVRANLIRYGSVFGIPGKDETSDVVPGVSLAAGVDIRAGRRAFIMLEYRRLDAEADFGSRSGGRVDVGGAFVLLGFRMSI